ncbi:hypothetical protein PILCRDRAFT_820528 [Piloderma croceum F 1598]|uniref:Uncharacterized protein n=1 Tax=Piloderma croceum (strain F 1598) TaxID=765440 RepID=A0A0C3B7F2_PILCF|nr:hypothetical protein PILCRDRAFT_820528 [Piloderma croceum F 1598]
MTSWPDEHIPGWTDALAQVLQPPLTDSFVHNLPSNPRHTRHPPGNIWKAALAHFVLSDLSLGIYGVRRYVRLEYLGLSGIILYHLPAGRLPCRSITAEDEYDEESGILTVQAVFGDENDTADEGMDMDDLIDVIHGRLVYFPAYACTSFAIGQVMNAIVHSSRVEPKPLRHGFVVDSTWFKSFKDCNYAEHRASYPTVPAIDMSRYFKPFKTTLRTSTNSLPDPERNAAAGISSTYSSEANCQDAARIRADDVEGIEIGETFDTTVDSLGPETPPMTPHNLPSKFKTRSSLVSSDISGGQIIFPLSVNKLQDGSVLGSWDLFHTRSAVDSDGAQPLVSVSNRVGCDGFATVDKEVMASKGKENVSYLS